MPTHVYIGYSAEALDIDAAAMTVALRPDFDPMLHRVRIAIKDDDSRLDGDRGADETGDDTGQTAVVRGLDGTLVAAGRIYDELHAVVTGGGQTITGEMLEIDGELVGFLSSAPLVPGVVYRVEATRNVGAPGIGPDDADPWLTTGSAVGAPSYSAYARVPCYVEGTLIRTDWGLRPIEMIGTGDLVETLDAGLQPVLWAGAVAVPLDRLAADPACRPVRIAAHAFGPDCPARDLLVSRQHRLALSSAAVQLWFGAGTVFAPAHALTNGSTIRSVLPAADIVYHHLLLGGHHALQAEGLWAESLFPGDGALLSLAEDQRQEVAALLGPRLASMTTAYRCLKPEEARLLAPRRPARARASRAA